MQQFSCVDVDDYATPLSKVGKDRFMMQKRTRGRHKTVEVKKISIDVEKINGDVQ